MSEPANDVACANCLQVRDATTVDPYGWCSLCRGVVIRRATIVARVVAALGLAGAAYWVFAIIDPGPRSLIVWLILLVAVYAVIYKVTQRVAFEAIRSRGVSPPRS